MTTNKDACVTMLENLNALVRDLLRERDELRAQVEALSKDLSDAKDSAAWHARRTSLLQSLQSTMQEPERTIVCDVLANGHLLQGPDGNPDQQRYAAPALTRPAVQVGSWSWLRGIIGGLAKHRHKMEGTGQTHTFVVLDDVLGWVDEGEKRAKLAAQQPEQVTRPAVPAGWGSDLFYKWWDGRKRALEDVRRFESTKGVAIEAWKAAMFAAAPQPEAQKGSA